MGAGRGHRPPEDAEKPLTRLWSVTPGEEDGLLYAGGAPGVLFESHDGGETWKLNDAFWEQPTRPDWSPGAGGMCMHSIATWPGDPVAHRAGDLGGRRVALRRRWPDVAARQQGPLPALHARGGTHGHDRSLRPQHAPGSDPARAPLHAVPRRRLPARTTPARAGRASRTACRPTSASRWCSIRTMRTAHTSSRSSRTWIVRRRRARCASTRPAMRGTVGSSVATASRRTTRTSPSCGKRSAARAPGPKMGLYFGATSGDVFGSGDAGKTWFTAATKLPPVHSVRVA